MRNREAMRKTTKILEFGKRASEKDLVLKKIRSMVR